LCRLLRAGLDVLEKRKIPCPFPGIEPRLLGCPALSLVAVLTDLPRLICESSKQFFEFIFMYLFSVFLTMLLVAKIIQNLTIRSTMNNELAQFKALTRYFGLRKTTKGPILEPGPSEYQTAMLFV
jgi:CDP-diglyceride synthetase